jgi:hypothetical protein
MPKGIYNRKESNPRPKTSDATREKQSQARLKSPARFLITKGQFKKGTKIRNTGRTHFKRGFIPWNKNKSGVYSKKTLEIMAMKKRGVKRPHTKEWNIKIGESQKGEKGNNWIDGRTPEVMRIRNSAEYKLWVKSCMIRDAFTCQKTGQRGGELEVHHINNFADFPELRLAIDNGITFSKKTHKEFHERYGRKNNTHEQLSEFLMS